MRTRAANERLTDWFARFRRWRSPLRKFLSTHWSLNASDFDDVAQEVFLRLLRYDNSELIEHPQAYLFRMASNVAGEWAVDFGTYTAPFFNSRNGDVETYTVTAPFNTTAQIKGVELGWTQPLVFGFGALANLTYSDGTTSSGTPVVGNSKYTYNIGGYFERWGFSANIDYTFRSHYLVGLDHSSLENEDDWGNLDASATYNFSKNFALNFNVLNITNETIKYYAANKDQPRAFYTNGRQFYFGVRLKL